MTFQYINTSAWLSPNIYKISTSECQAAEDLMAGTFKLEQVLAVANKHPFYSSVHEYPLTPEDVEKVLSEETSSEADSIESLSQLPITRKEDM